MVLLVSHGGFNTLTESGFRVPILFVPLHSDHKSTPPTLLPGPAHYGPASSDIGPLE